MTSTIFKYDFTDYEVKLYCTGLFETFLMRSPDRLLQTPWTPKEMISCLKYESIRVEAGWRL